MAATTPRPQARPKTGPQPGPRSGGQPGRPAGQRPSGQRSGQRPQQGQRPAGQRSGQRPQQGQRRTVTVQFIGPWQNAMEGALALLYALGAMLAVTLVALLLLDASSVGSVFSLTMAVIAMAVGGSITAGSASSGADSSGMGGLASMFGGGGGGMSASMSGAADVVPLGVTLVGAVVLWITFARRLRKQQQRRFTPGELAVRVSGAAGAALFVFMIVAGLGSGSFTLPASAMSSMGGGMPGGSGSSAMGGMGGIMGGMGGSGGMGGMMGGSSSAMTYHVGAASAGFGAVLWVTVVLGVGLLISRKVRLPLGGTLDGLRTGWGGSLSPLVRTVLVIASVPIVVLVVVGMIVGGKVAQAAGAVLLLAPNAVAMVLTMGAGSSWTAGMHPASSGSSGGLASMMGGMGGMGGSTGGMGGMTKDRTEDISSIAPGGMPLWFLALIVTSILLIACAYRATRVTNPAHRTPLHSYDGPLASHLGMAQRFGIVTAVVLGVSAWMVSASGNFGVSMFGSTMGGMSAELEGSVLKTVAFGLVIGAVTGFLGSLLASLRGPQKPREPRARTSRGDAKVAATVAG